MEQREREKRGRYEVGLWKTSKSRVLEVDDRDVVRTARVLKGTERKIMVVFSNRVYGGDTSLERTGRDRMFRDAEV